MKNIFKISLAAILLLTLTSFQQDIDTNAKIKSVFIYNFTKYIEWPKNYREGNFIIGVIGDESLKKELISMAQIKKVGNQKIEVVEFDPEKIEKCHILVLSRDKSHLFDLVLKKTKKLSSLLITEGNGLATAGACINFIVVNNRLKFEMNKKNIEDRGLKVNSALESMAILVN